VKTNIVIITFFLSTLSFAKTDQLAGAWLGYFANHKLTDKEFLHFETQLRHNTTDSKMGQTLVRFGVNHSLNERNKVGLLFAYVDSDAAKEYRLALQHQFTFSSKLSFRQRLEARDIENNDSNSIRYRLNTRFDGAVTVWDEVFVNLTRETWTGDRAFERNRFFIGPKHKFNSFVLEWGYLNQYIPRSEKSAMEHILVGYLFF